MLYIHQRTVGRSRRIKSLDELDVRDWVFYFGANSFSNLFSIIPVKRVPLQTMDKLRGEDTAWCEQKVLIHIHICNNWFIYAIYVNANEIRIMTNKNVGRIQKIDNVYYLYIQTYIRVGQAVIEGEDEVNDSNHGCLRGMHHPYRITIRPRETKCTENIPITTGSITASDWLWEKTHSKTCIFVLFSSKKSRLLRRSSLLNSRLVNASKAPRRNDGWLNKSKYKTIQWLSLIHISEPTRPY